MNVRVTCPDCGDTAVGVETVLVVRNPGAASGDTFRFTCPACLRSVEKRATGRVPEMLLTAGASEHAPPPLSLADLADLRRDLEADDWLKRLLA